MISKNALKNIFLITFIFMIIFFNIINLNIPYTIGVFLLFIDIYSVIKYRKNIYLFFIFIALLYFDYSFLISKYFSTTSTLVTAYAQIKYSNTMMLGVSLVTVFHCIIILFLRNKNITDTKKEQIFTIDKTKNYDLAILILIAIIMIILLDYFVLHIFSFGRTIYEYTLILFVFAFYFSKKSNKKIYSNILFHLMFFSTLINMIQGARVISLQPMIAYFFINYSDKLSYKKITCAFIAVIIIFTAFGIYGDYLDYGYDLKNLNFEVIIDAFSDRKFSLDTSISSYWTGLTIIETSKVVPFADRVMNFIQYITVYAIKGASSSYTQLYDISLQYYVHYNGGYIISYFYYWFGWLGIFFIGTYIGKLIKSISELKNSSSDFMKLVSIYIIATLPRWYLYYPVAFFRGMLIFIIVYIFSYKVMIKNNRRIK